MNNQEKEACALMLGLLRGAITDTQIRSLYEITDCDPVDPRDPLDPPTMIANCADGMRVEITVNVVGGDPRGLLNRVRQLYGPMISKLDPEISEKLDQWLER